MCCINQPKKNGIKPPPPPPRHPEEIVFCKWKYDEIYNYYETECKNAFVIDEGTPDENNFMYCVFCGKIIDAEKLI